MTDPMSERDFMLPEDDEFFFDETQGESDWEEEVDSIELSIDQTQKKPSERSESHLLPTRKTSSDISQTSQLAQQVAQNAAIEGQRSSTCKRLEVFLQKPDPQGDGVEIALDFRYCSPILRQSYLLLDALAKCAEHAATPQEAILLTSSMVPFAIQLIPEMENALYPYLPVFCLGLAGATRELYKRIETRPQIRRLPLALNLTLSHLAEKRYQGIPMDQTAVAKLLASQIERVTGSYHQVRPPKYSSKPAQEQHLPPESKAPADAQISVLPRRSNLTKGNNGGKSIDSNANQSARIDKASD